MQSATWLLPLRHKVARLRARVRDRTTIAYDANGILIPRAHLSSLVTGTFDTDYFLTSGRRSAELIRDPRAVRTWPAQVMPPFPADHLSDREIGLIVAYLKHMAGRKQAQ